MRDCLPLLVAVCTLQTFVGRVSAPVGNGSLPPTLLIPPRTPGMTDGEYAQAVNNALSGIPGAVFSFTGSRGRPVSGKVGNPTNYASPFGSRRSTTSRPPPGYYGPRPLGYSQYSTPGNSYSPPPAGLSQHLSQNIYPFSGISGGRRPAGRITYSSYLLPGDSGNLQPAFAAPPAGNYFSNYGNHQGNTPTGVYSPSTGYSQPPSPIPRRPFLLSGNPPGLGSPSTGYPQPAPAPNPRRPFLLSGNSGGLWGPNLSPTTAVANNGGSGNSYDSKHSQPTPASDSNNEDNAGSSLTANQFGLRNGAAQNGVGGVQQQQTYSQTTPVFDPKPTPASDRNNKDNPAISLTENQFSQRNGAAQNGVGGVQQQQTSSPTTPVFDLKGGNNAAETIALAIVGGLRNVWNTQHKLVGGEKLMMNVCEQAVANQQPAMKEMKKSDKTLLDVLPLWREKLIVELETFFRKEVRATEVYRGSSQLDTMLLVFAECVRPKLVLMKV